MQLFSIISAFDAAYAEYNGFQSGIERYWTLQYLAQNGITELNAVVMKDGLVRADDLPLVFRTPGTESLPRGAHVRVGLSGSDLLTLDIHASLVARLDDTAAAATPANDAETDADDAADSAGPLSLAIDIADDGGSTAAPAADVVTAS